MTILDRLDSNWSREEREKLNNNWTIIESYLSNLQGQINFLTGNVNVQELIDQLKSLLGQGTIILDELKSALINVEEIIVDAQNATKDANDAAQKALNAVNDIQGMLDNFQVRGTYNNDTVYSKNNSVFYEGSSYIYTNNTPSKGNPPPNYPTVANDHWQMTAAKGASGDGAVSKVNGKEPDGAGEVILTASDVGAASTEQLEQLEQTTKNHIDDNTKHLLPGQSDKINNSWQKGVYNDTYITNLGSYNASKIIRFNDWDADNSKLDAVYINIPVRNFSGILKLTLTGDYNVGNTMGGAEVIYQIGKVDEIEHAYSKTIVSMSTAFAGLFYIGEANYQPNRIYLPITKAPNSRNPLNIKIELFNISNNAFTIINDIGVARDAAIAQPYPWTPQKDLNQRIAENFTSFSSFKFKIASATTDKGVPTNADATGDQMATNIRAIPTGVKKANFNVSYPDIPPNQVATVTTTAMNFKPMNSTFPMYGAYLMEGRDMDLNDMAPYISVIFLSRITVNNLGNGTYTLTLRIKNPTSITYQAAALPMIVTG